MSRRIVSWRINEPSVSPTLSNASAVSVVSISSIVSDMTTEATGVPVQHAEPGAKLENLPGSAHPTSEDSFVRHDTYFFKDGNITFLVHVALLYAPDLLTRPQVDGTLYCVHRYFFSRDSVYFSSKFGQLDVRDHEPLGTIISLDDVERKDFEASLSVIYPV